MLRIPRTILKMQAQKQQAPILEVLLEDENVEILSYLVSFFVSGYLRLPLLKECVFKDYQT